MQRESRGTPPSFSAPSPVRFTALLAATMGIPSLVTFSIGALGPSIVTDLALSRTDLGLVSSMASVAGIVGSLFLGRLVDRLGARAVLFGLLGGSGVSLLLLAATPFYGILLLVGGLAGLAQACANPVTNSLIAEFTTPDRRGTVLGVKQSGVQMGQFFAGFTLPPLAVVVGWRSSVLLALVLVAGTTIWGHRDIPRGRSRNASDRPSSKQAAASRSIDRDLLWLCAYTFLIALPVQPINIYLPLYAYETGLLSATGAGMAVGVVGTVGVVGRIGVGHFAARLQAPSAWLAPLAIVAVAAMIAMTFAQTAGVGLLWLGAVLFSLSALTGNVVIMLTVLARTPEGGTGHASGLVSAAMFVGFTLSPAAFGLVVDATDHYPDAWALVAASAVMAALCGARIYRHRPQASI